MAQVALRVASSGSQVAVVIVCATRSPFAIVAIGLGLPGAESDGAAIGAMAKCVALMAPVIARPQGDPGVQ